MPNQNALLGKREIKSPPVLLFVAVYIFAVVVGLWTAPTQALAYVGMSLGILFLIWLILEITKKLRIEDIKVRKPGLELAFACLIILLFEYVPLPWPRLEFGDKWYLNSMVRKGVLLFILPCIFLRLRKNSFLSMGLSFFNWKPNLKIAGITFVCMAIPSAFFVGDTGSLILSGKLSLAEATLGFPVLFIHNIALSGLTEEFFYRAFIQTRLSQILKSKLGGILVTSLYFGLTHIPDIMRWYPDMTLPEAFCRAFFMQGFIGLLMGVLWARTHNLISGITVHSGINALNNLGSITSLIALR